MADGMTVFAKYKNWVDSLPKCLGDEIGCEGDLHDGFNGGFVEGLRLAEEIAKTPISKLYGMDVMRKYDEIAEAIRAEREKLEGQQ